MKVQKRYDFKKEILASIFLHIAMVFILFWNVSNEYSQKESIRNKNIPFMHVVMEDSINDISTENHQYKKKEKNILNQFKKENQKKMHDVNEFQRFYQQQKIPVKKESESKREYDKKRLFSSNFINIDKKSQSINDQIETKIQNKKKLKDLDNFIEHLELNELDFKSNNDEIRSHNIKKDSTENNIQKKFDKEINNYADKIKSAIESCFYDASFYSGKTCTLRIHLMQDGKIFDIQPEGGDTELCTAALEAARQAKLPKPPSKEIYEIFRNISLDFKPSLIRN